MNKFSHKLNITCSKKSRRKYTNIFIPTPFTTTHIYIFTYKNCKIHLTIIFYGLLLSYHQNQYVC